MEKSKPFSIQAPEQIAKDYAGNKQKIAEAMQMGVVDPTAGILAGMFIDRMRSAQMQEMAQKPTIAQQVMGGPPAQAPLAPAGGLGATAPAPAPMAPAGPPMEAAPPMDAMPPMGMAEGGLAAIPVPDSMFDEPEEDGMAGGGLVAFADGGMSNLYDAVEYWESGGKQGSVSPKGARGVMQLMPGTMRDPGFGVAPMQADTEEENRRVGREYLDAMYRRYGDQSLALAAYNWGPGNVDKWLKSGADPKKLPSETRSYISNVMKGTEAPLPERDINTAQGRAGSLEDLVGVAQRYMKPSDEELAVEEKQRKRFEEQASDEYYEKQRKDSMWETLAAIGFNMASSKSPYVLQAIGEAAAAAMPGAKTDKKERKELKDRALDGLMALGARNRQRANEAFKVGADLYRSGVEAEQAEKLMEFRYKELTSRENTATLDRNAQLAAALARRDNPTQFDTIIAAIMQSNPGMNKLQAIDYAKKKGYFGSSQGGMALPGVDGAGAEMDTSGMSIIGSRPVQ